MIFAIFSKSLLPLTQPTTGSTSNPVSCLYSLIHSCTFSISWIVSIKFLLGSANSLLSTVLYSISCISSTGGVCRKKYPRGILVLRLNSSIWRKVGFLVPSSHRFMWFINFSPSCSSFVWQRAHFIIAGWISTVTIGITTPSFPYRFTYIIAKNLKRITIFV